MKAKKRVSGHANWALRIIVVACVAFAFVKVVQIQVQINQKQEELRRKEEAIAMAELYNENLEEKSANFEKHVEQFLREQGYVKDTDQIYQFSN